MRQAEFEQRHEADWRRLERWLARRAMSARTRRALQQRLGESTDDALRDADVPAQYRLACAHLALARERCYSPTLVARLHRLVLDGHHALYGAQARGGWRIGRYLAWDFPRTVRREWRVVALAALLFFAPLLALLVAVQAEPELAAVVMSPLDLAQLQQMYDPDNERLGARHAGDDAQMFGFYIWNNVRIGFQTFAGGVVFGLGTLFFLLFNGVYIGAVLGHLTQVGLGPQVWSFVAGHSALELTAIAISGAAGLKLGGALLRPGRRSRRQALVEDGRIALALMGGAALMFLAAAATEAFWSARAMDDPRPKYAIGVVAWVLLLAYLAFAGRGTDRSRAD